MFGPLVTWSVIVSLLGAVAGVKTAWLQQTIRPAVVADEKFSLPDQHANLSLSADLICQLDRLQISFNVSRLLDANELAIGYIRAGQATGSIVTLEQISTDLEERTDSRGGLVTCDINESHCTPKVREIKAQSDKNLLELQFEVATNEVPLPNATTVFDALDIVPRLSYSNMSGQWTAPDALALQLSSQDMQRILSAHGNGEKIEVTARQQRPRDRRGRVTIRPSEAGEYEVVMVDRTRGMRRLPAHVSAPQYVRVELCDDAVVMPGIVDQSAHLQVTNHSPETSTGRAGGGVMISATAGANKLLTIPGPAALTGAEALAFSDNTVDPSKSGTFSVSTWICLVEPPTGRFRAVLHKGSSDGRTRTPSLWLMPNDNRLSVRVSTAANADTGAETIGALPVNQWAHLAVVFENHTHSAQAATQASGHADATATATAAALTKHTEGGFRVSHPPDYYAQSESEGAVNAHTSAAAATTGPSAAGSPQYTVSVYLNGVLDVKIDFTDPVIGNEFSASFFKDVSFKGPRGFLDDFTIWSGAMTTEQVQAEFLSATGRSRRAAVDAALDVLETAENCLVFRTPDSDRATTIGNDPLVPILLQRAKDSLNACEAFEARLDLYADAAERGSAEALYRWALLVKQGSEVGNSACGVATAEETNGGGAIPSALKGTVMASLWGGSADGSVQSGNSHTSDHDRATLAFLVAADMGHAPALTALAFTLLNGAGASALLLHNTTELQGWNLPVPASYRAGLGTTAFATALRARLLAGLDSRCSAPVWTNPVASQVAVESDIGRSVLQAVISGRDSVGNIAAVLGQFGKSVISGCTDPSQLAQGLLEVAAMHGDAEAHQALYYRYKEGLGVEADEETAAFYQRLPARVTGEEFDRVGAQAIVEMDRIDDKTTPQVSRGNEGNDDELIQHQKIRAQEGHLPSILAMADLYYYGARGLPRDHARALRYYEQAAGLGDQSGLCGAAGMYLKGEGTPTNVTRAVSLYEEASELGSIRALNGLGYMYFYGQSVPQNQTKAFEYFLTAASYETDGDSLFNAAHCLENGLGVEKDLSRAVQLYTVGAKKLGSFNCIRSLAGMYLEGRGVTRSAKTALSYFSAATAIGPWAGWVRRGLDQYLRGHYDRSLGAYLHAAELGFEVGQSNAAYILRAKLRPANHATPPSPPVLPCSPDDTCAAAPLVDLWGNATTLHDSLLARLYRLSAHHGSRDSYLQLGTCYFKGHCGVGVVDHQRALWHYSKASYLGSHLGSAYLGVMYHFGLGTSANPNRAARYYALALEQDTDKSVSSFVQSLQYALSAKDYYFMMPINLGLDYVVRTLW